MTGVCDKWYEKHIDYILIQIFRHGIKWVFSLVFFDLDMRRRYIGSVDVTLLHWVFFFRLLRFSGRGANQVSEHSIVCIQDAYLDTEISPPTGGFEAICIEIYGKLWDQL